MDHGIQDLSHDQVGKTDGVSAALLMAASATQNRKSEHLRINVEEDVQAKGVSAGFEHYRFDHMALPDLDARQIDLSITFLGHSLRVPILISCMTGGVAEAGTINHRLAVVAEELGCAMGVGSQRAALEDPTGAAFFRIRDVAPHVPILANLGAVQLNYGYGVDHCRRAVEMVDAQILVLHLNPLQEAVQDHGNTDFRGLIDKIALVCTAVPVPVVVKEVGWGISAPIARQLAAVGVAAIDVAGAGGTSWSEVERHRAPTPLLRSVAAAFAGWGVPTAECLVEVRRVLPDIPLIASGGLRDGVDLAKALALGAHLGGFAGPLLRAAHTSTESAMIAVQAISEQLRVAMFCAGVGSIADLRQTTTLRVSRP